MKGKIALTAALFGILQGASSREASSIEIALEGYEYQGPSTSADSDWFAVTRTASGIRLIRTRIEVVTVFDSCTESSKKQITTLDVKDSLFLVRGLKSLRDGPLDSVFEGSRRIPPSKSSSFRLASGLQFGFKANGKSVPVGGGSSEIQIFDYEIEMFQGNTVQVLGKYSIVGEDGGPELMWAGDLDRDGRPDALYNLKEGYGGLHTLLLSSFAGEGRLVRNVAEFSHTIC